MRQGQNKWSRNKIKGDMNMIRRQEQDSATRDKIKAHKYDLRRPGH